MDEENNLEVVPLKSRLSFNAQHSSSKLARSLSSSVAAEEDVFQEESPQLWQQLIASFLFYNFGWYFPRYLSSLDASIEAKDAPYQKLTSGDVVLDPSLNQPFVYPPTVGCKLHICLDTDEVMTASYGQLDAFLLLNFMDHTQRNSCTLREFIFLFSWS